MLANGLPAFLDEVPNYEVRDGRMHISTGTFVLIMPVSVCVAALARCGSALDEWFAEQTNVVRMGKH